MNIELDEPTILIISGECYSSKSRNSKWFEMNTKNRQYGVCGVYCGQCPSGNGRVKMMAGELKRLVDTARYD